MVGKMRAEGDQQMRRLCSERGLEWDRLTDEERINLVDDLIHEDRPDALTRVSVTPVA